LRSFGTILLENVKHGRYEYPYSAGNPFDSPLVNCDVGASDETYNELKELDSLESGD
jgi:hypothetical protein